MRLELALPYIYPYFNDKNCDGQNGAGYMHLVMKKALDAYIQHMKDYGLPAYNYEEIAGAKAFREAMNLAATQYINRTYKES